MDVLTIVLLILILIVILILGDRNDYSIYEITRLLRNIRNDVNSIDTNKKMITEIKNDVKAIKQNKLKYIKSVKDAAEGGIFNTIDPYNTPYKIVDVNDVDMKARKVYVKGVWFTDVNTTNVNEDLFKKELGTLIYKHFGDKNIMIKKDE